MENNLPMKNDNSFIGKIKKIFRSFFIKYEKSDTKTIINNNIKKENKDNLQESIRCEVIKNDYLKELKREEFLDDIQKNPSLLYNLPLEKLEKIEEYYHESISKYEEKLSKLKRDSL